VEGLGTRTLLLIVDQSFLVGRVAGQSVGPVGPAALLAPPASSRPAGRTSVPTRTVAPGFPSRSGSVPATGPRVTRSPARSRIPS